MILITTKFEYVRVSNLDKWKIESQNGIEKTIYLSSILTSKKWIFLTPNEQKLWDRIFENHITLNDELVAEPFTGIQSSLDSVYVIKKWTKNGNYIEFTDKDGNKRSIEKNILKPYLLPANTGRTSFKSFETKNHDGWVLFPYKVTNGKAKTIPKKTLKRKFPNAYSYLSHFKKDLGKRSLDAHSKDWYRFGRSQALTKIEKQPKIIVGVLFKEERYIYDKNDMYFQTGDTAGYVGIKMQKKSKYSIFYILGLLNHTALEWVSSKRASTFERDYIAHGQTLLRDLPIRKIDFSKAAERKIHDQIVQTVKEIIKLHKESKSVKTDRELKTIDKSILEKRTKLDKTINSLYGIDKLIKYAEIP